MNEDRIGLILSVRVADMPYSLPHYQRTPCIGCKEIVWLTPTAVKAAHGQGIKETKPLCFQCGKDVFEKSKVQPEIAKLTDEQKEEILQEFMARFEYENG